MKVGIIGGSGLYHLEELEEVEEVHLDTPFGKPSSNFVTGKVNGIRVSESIPKAPNCINQFIFSSILNNGHSGASLT